MAGEALVKGAIVVDETLGVDLGFSLTPVVKVLSKGEIRFSFPNGGCLAYFQRGQEWY